MNKHLRPYNCSIPTCKVNPFATKGDLHRHQREVHSSPGVHNCPITTCQRHTRGFSRKQNLMQHIERLHSLDTGEVASSTPSLVRQSFMGQDAGIVVGLTSETIVQPVSTSGPDKSLLMAKLQGLENEKTKAIEKFDGYIDALKRVLSFM